jgi:hypothetical protein
MAVMPSKSDIQFGKIVVTNHMATKEEVETALKSQAHFERERHTIILEGILLSNECLTIEQVEAIQNKMERRVIFCEKCHGKFNVYQFRGGERFLCHKCGNKVTVPDSGQYRSIIATLAEKVGGFLSGEPEVEETSAEPAQRETIMLRREDIEHAKGSAPPPEDDLDEVLELDSEVESAIEEEVVDGEVVEEDEPGIPSPGADAKLLPETETPGEGTEIPEAPPEKAKGMKNKKKKLKKKKKAAKGEKDSEPKRKKGKLKKRDPKEGKPRLRRKR